MAMTTDKKIKEEINKISSLLPVIQEDEKSKAKELADLNFLSILSRVTVESAFIEKKSLLEEIRNRISFKRSFLGLKPLTKKDASEELISQTLKYISETNLDVIHSIYLSKVTSDSMCYSIVLNDDNLENRNKISYYFQLLDSMETSTKSVLFQFFPVELEGKISYIEKLS